MSMGRSRLGTSRRPPPPGACACTGCQIAVWAGWGDHSRHRSRAACRCGPAGLERELQVIGDISPSAGCLGSTAPTQPCGQRALPGVPGTADSSVRTCPRSAGSTARRTGPGQRRRCTACSCMGLCVAGRCWAAGSRVSMASSSREIKDLQAGSRQTRTRWTLKIRLQGVDRRTCCTVAEMWDRSGPGCPSPVSQHPAARRGS